MNPTRKPIATRGRLAVAAALACGAFLGISASSASAANPSILNTGTGCSGQTSWLISCATEGSTDNGGNILRISTWLSHDANKSLSSLLTDDDWDGTSDPGTVRSAGADRPNIAGGYPRSRVDLSYTLPTSNTGFSCGPFSFTRRTSDRNARIKGRDSSNQDSGTSSSQIKFVAGNQCTGAEDYAYIYSWGANNFNNNITPGQSVTFTYTGDDKDTTGSSDFNGVFWRIRNIRTGATSGGTLDCDNNGDNAQKSTTVTFPDRGAFVVEAELRDGGSCSDNQNGGYWFPLGTADVNSTAAPSLTLDSATTTVGGVVRPQFGQDFSVRAQGLVDPDSGDGGGAQILEWDLDNNTGNGVSGLETTDIAGFGSTLTAPVSHNVDSSSLSAGLYSVRARVTDNGAGDAADSIRRTSSIQTLQYRVDAAPSATNQTVSTESDLPLPITLSGTDADGDSLSYSIVTNPSHGSLSGSGANRTYTPDGNFAGQDSFTFKVDDGFGRTATGTATIDVTPQTQFDSTPGATSGQTAQFEFSSPVTSPTPGFQCKLDGGSFSACSSPLPLTGLTEGSHTLQVRAVAASDTDPTPASYTWNVDATPPSVTLDTFPDDPTNQTTAGFSFHANEPVSGFQCEIDGGGFSACGSSPTYSSLGDGPHTFKVKATDVYGNEGAPQSYTWSIDSTPPNTQIDSNPAAMSNSTMASFTYSATEGGSTFECKLDGGSFTPCNAQPQVYSGLGQGSHTFQVRATDPAGNTDPGAASFTWTVDTIAPATSIDEGSVQWPPPGITHPQHHTTSPDADFEFFSNDANATFECRLDSSLEADFQPCDTPLHYTGLNDGPHKFEVRAKDQAGNVDQTPATYTWSSHSGLPDTILSDYPQDPTNSSSAHFEFDSSIPDSTFRCSLDGAPLATCTSPQDYTVGAGSHTFEVVATDEFGRDDPSPASYTWFVDQTPPNTVIDDHPLDPSNSDDASFTFHSTEPSSTLECQLDGGGWQTCDENLPEIYTDLEDGPHTFEVRATDPAGNVDPTPDSFTWRVDTSAPETSIDVKPSDPSKVVDPAFQFSSNEDPNVDYFCQLDAQAAGPCDTGFQVHDLLEGSHTFSVYAVDAAGNADLSPATYRWFVDLTPPDTMITSQPLALESTTAATFEFEGTDTHSDSGDLTFECRLNSTDEGDFQPCSSGDSFTAAEGPNTLDVRALDEAGNWDPSPDSYTWTVDTTAPDTSIDVNPDDPTSSGAAVFNFSSTESGSTFRCELDGNGIDPCSTGDDFGPVGEGSHTFKVWAKDTAGNEDATPATYTWTVDQTAPETQIDAQPDDPTRSDDAVFDFSGTDNHSDAGDLTFECQLDGGGFNPCSSGHNFGPVGEGLHTFEVQAVDEAGNVDASASTYTWTVDQTAPETQIDAQPGNPTSSTGATFQFSGSDNHSDGADLTFECQLDGAGWNACSSGDDFGPVGEGSHTFEVKATDEAGNTDGSPATYTWTVDQTAPETQIDAQPDDPTSSAAAAFEFSGTDNHSDSGDLTFACQLDGGGFSPCSSGDDLGPVGEGSHTFEVKAIDEAGNADSSPASFTWTVDQTAPDTQVDNGPTDPTNSTGAVLGFSGTDNHSASGDLTFECELDGAGFNACTSGHDFGPLGDGSHTLKVRATDESGNTDQSPAVHTWTVDTQAPTVNIDSGPADPTNHTDADLAFTTGGDPTAVDCDLDGGGFSPCDSNSAQSYSGLGEGSHTVTVKVTDAAGNSSTDAYTWTVDLTPPDTNIGDTPADPTNETSADFTFAGSESGSTLACQLDGGGFSPCDSATAQHYGSLGAGPHTFDVRATDPAGNTDPSPDSYTWTVDTTPPDVEVVSGPTGIVNQTDASFDWTVDDSGATFECDLDGAGFVPCSSPAWTYNDLADGEHTFTVRASDTAGNTDADSRTWTVDTGPPDTTISSQPDDGTTSTDASFSFGSSEEPSSYECKLDGGAFQACGSPKSYSGLSAGSHTFSVRATDSAGNTDPSAATYSWTIAQQQVQGASGGSPVIKRRIRALNVPSEGQFQIATVGCRSASCTITRKEAKIKIGQSTFSPPVTVEVVAKQSTDSLHRAEVARVIVHFPLSVKQSLVRQHIGQLVVNVGARTDGLAAESTASKKIKLKAKWLKAHLR